MNKVKLFCLVVLFMTSACSNESVNSFYPSNSSPLRSSRFVRLPLGSIRPAGWLKDQLSALADGLTGHLDEFWPDLIHSAWRGGEGESWERGPYYLDGLVPLAYMLEDEKLIKKAQKWVDSIMAGSREDGWFGPPKNTDRWPLAVALKVLTQYHEVTGDPGALKTIQNFFAYLHDHPPDWPDDTWRGVRAMEHAVTGYWLFRRTKDEKILAAIESIFTHSFDWTNYFETFPWDGAAVKEGKIPHNWKADGLTAHVVNNAMAVKYPGLWYQQSGDARFKEAVYKAINDLDRHHGQVGGRFSGDEHLSGRRPGRGTELCAVVEYMYSLENLIEIFGDPLLADRLESLAYNSLPGTMTPDGWAHQYDQQSNQVLVTNQEREWSTNGNSANIYGLMPNYPCCLANMHQGWPKFVEHMWMATADQGLAAVAYGPCTVSARVGRGARVRIVEKTGYPFDGDIQLKIEISRPCRFPIYLRIPAWAKASVIQFKGRTINSPGPGRMVKIESEWRQGDLVRLNIPLEIRVESRYNGAASILRGPLYYALRIAKEYRKVQLHGKHITSIDYLGTTDFEIRPRSAWNYGLLLDRDHPARDIVVRINPLYRFPFADKGEQVFFRDDLKYMKWPHDAPVVLKIMGRRIPAWGMKKNSADDPPPGPVKSTEKTENLYLVPYGCARLRITEFPLVSTDP